MLFAMALFLLRSSERRTHRRGARPRGGRPASGEGRSRCSAGLQSNPIRRPLYQIRMHRWQVCIGHGPARARA